MSHIAQSSSNSSSSQTLSNYRTPAGSGAGVAGAFAELFGKRDDRNDVSADEGNTTADSAPAAADDRLDSRRNTAGRNVAPQEETRQERARRESRSDADSGADRALAAGPDEREPVERAEFEEDATARTADVDQETLAGTAEIAQLAVAPLAEPVVDPPTRSLQGDGLSVLDGPGSTGIPGSMGIPGNEATSAVAAASSSGPADLPPASLAELESVLVKEGGGEVVPAADSSDIVVPFSSLPIDAEPPGELSATVDDASRSGGKSVSTGGLEPAASDDAPLDVTPIVATAEGDSSTRTDLGAGSDLSNGNALQQAIAASDAAAESVEGEASPTGGEAGDRGSVSVGFATERTTDVARFAAGQRLRGESGSALTQQQQTRMLDRVRRAFDVARQRGGPLRIRLHPPELGSLKLEVQVQRGVVRAQLETDTVAARTALIEHLGQLKERLAEAGLRVESFDIEWRGQWKEPSGGDQQDAQRGAFDGSRGGRRGGSQQGDTETADVADSAERDRLDRTGHNGGLNVRV